MWFVRPSPRRDFYPSDRRFHVAPHVASARCADETFVLNKKTGRYYKLDDVSTELWPLLRDTVSLHDLLVTLGDTYDMPPESLTGDIVALLRRLVEYGIVESED